MHIYDKRRFFAVVVALVLISGGLLAFRFGYVPEIGKFFAAEPTATQLFSGVTLKYSKIFGPSDIPLPASTANTDARVKAVYSPSVIMLDGTYWMFFGVSIYCNGWSTARDSIALAKSTDGDNWQFDRYIIEPDARSCTAGSLPTGATYQVNDPSAQVMPDGTVAVFYTGVLWHEPSNVSECGVIGLAKFDRGLNLLSRNDRYFVPSATYCGPGKLGFSRPDLQWTDAATTRLWFDSAFHIKSIPLTSLDSLNDANVRDEGLVGGDLNVPLLDYNSTLVLINGSTVTAVQRNDGGAWESSSFLPAKSGQGWDRDGQGSPDLLIDETSCKVKLYMSGSQLNTADPTGYDALNIGMAVPADNRSFNLPICSNYKPVDRSPVGFFDAVDCTSGSGWATDPDSEGQAVTVRFFDGPAQDNWTNLLGELKADAVRGAPVGSHGFVWAVPAKIKDGQPHRIYAYAYSNETPTVFLQLPNTGANVQPPAAITCQPSTALTSPTATANVTRLISPNGGEVWIKGQTNRITWESTWPASEDMKIWVGRDDDPLNPGLGSIIWLPGSSDDQSIPVKNTGYYDLTIPVDDPLKCGNNTCYPTGSSTTVTVSIERAANVKKFDHVDFDWSDGRFSIIPPATATPKPGDANGDGKVDIFDYNAVVGDFGKTGTGLAGDLDKNGKVDIFDYNAVVSNFNR